MAKKTPQREIERIAAVNRLWLELSEEERNGNMAVLKFHAWLRSNRPDLLSKAPGDSSQQLKSDLRNNINPDQA